MLKLVTKSRKFVSKIAATFAFVIGVSSATGVTFVWCHQPKCPQHLLK